MCVCVCGPRDYTDPFPGLSLSLAGPVSINSLVQEGHPLSRRRREEGGGGESGVQDEEEEGELEEDDGSSRRKRRKNKAD